MTDLDRLRADYPGWRIGTIWATVGTGPDFRALTAYRDGVLLADPTETGLREKIEIEEKM